MCVITDRSGVLGLGGIMVGQDLEQNILLKTYY